MTGQPWVVLPTYDEAANVEAVVRAVLAALPAARVLAAGADLVIGSRYVPGGGIADWGA